MKFILYLLLLFAPPVLANQDTDFLAAHDAYIANKPGRLEKLAQRLKSSPLEVYVRYYQLSLELENNGDKPVPNALISAVQSFLSRPEDTPVLDELRGEWLKLLGKNQQWSQFDAEYPRLINQDSELSCYALQSRIWSHELSVLREVRDMWFTGNRMPENCGPLFEAALNAGVIDETDVRHRLRLALEANNVPLAIQLSERLDKKYAGFSAMMRSAAANPDRYLRNLTPDETRLAKDSAAEASKVIVDEAIDAEVSGTAQPSPSGHAQTTPAPSSTSSLAWQSILSRLGISWQSESSSAAEGELPRTSQTGSEAACGGACVDMGDDSDLDKFRNFG